MVDIAAPFGGSSLGTMTVVIGDGTLAQSMTVVIGRRL
jgi:hypothetical protein